MVRMLIIIMLVCSTAHAHKLYIMATAENDSLSVSSYFHDGKVCKGCKVSVADNFGNVIADGKLDDSGNYFHAGKLPDEMIITVDAGLGHMSQETVKTNDTVDMNSEIVPTDAEDVRKIIRQEMAKQTSELKAEINKNRSNVDKIIAGIGYILGIFGLLVLLRKK